MSRHRQHSSHDTALEARTSSLTKYILTKREPESSTGFSTCTTHESSKECAERTFSTVLNDIPCPFTVPEFVGAGGVHIKLEDGTQIFPPKRRQHQTAH